MKKLKKKFKKAPSMRLKKTVANLMENHGNVSKAMLDAGFSKNYSKNPQELTNTKAFIELAAQVLPDELLLKVHLQGLQATAKQSLVVGYKPMGKGRKSLPIVRVTNDPDYGIRHKYLDTAYKILGKIKPEQVNVFAPINLSDDRVKFA